MASQRNQSTRTWRRSLQHHKNTVAFQRVICSWYCTRTLEHTQQLASISKRASSCPKNLHKSAKSASILKRLRLLYRDLWTNIISWGCLKPTLEQSNQQWTRIHFQKKNLGDNWSSLGITPITSKSICKTKFSADGKIEKHKASLVAQGFEQTKGMDGLWRNIWTHDQMNYDQNCHMLCHKKRMENSTSQHQNISRWRNRLRNPHGDSWRDNCGSREQKDVQGMSITKSSLWTRASPPTLVCQNRWCFKSFQFD